MRSGDDPTPVRAHHSVSRTRAAHDQAGSQSGTGRVPQQRRPITIEPADESAAAEVDAAATGAAVLEGREPRQLAHVERGAVHDHRPRVQDVGEWHSTVLVNVSGRFWYSVLS